MLSLMDPLLALVFLPALIIGISVHEFAHALAASLLGDDFPRRQGRVSLNPLRHLSPLGTLVIFLLPIGWGRPVEVNLYNFRRPKLDYLLTSLAGPLGNIVLAGLLMLLMLLTRHSFLLGNQLGDALMQLGHSAIRVVALINVILAGFNLLPIPPLDGSKIWPCLIPGARPTSGKKLTWVFVAVLLTMVWTGRVRAIINPVIETVSSILPESDADRAESLGQQADGALLLKQYDLAERLSDEQLAIHQSPEAYCTRALARGWLGNWEGALDDMNRAISLQPLLAEYYEYRADTLEAVGQEAEAAKDRDKALMLLEIGDQSP